MYLPLGTKKEIVFGASRVTFRVDRATGFCAGCYFNRAGGPVCNDESLRAEIGDCSPIRRADGASVVFSKVSVQPICRKFKTVYRLHYEDMEKDFESIKGIARYLHVTYCAVSQAMKKSEPINGHTITIEKIYL